MISFPAIILGFAILLVITRPFTTLFHELGHAIPRMLATKQGVTMYIGSYGNKKHSLHLRLGNLDIWLRYNPIGWSGGICISEAVEKTITMRIVTVMGGVVFSLVIMIILVYIAFSLDMHGAVKLITVFALGSTLFDIYSNLIPREFKSADGKTYYTDGYLLRMLLPLRKYPADYLEALKLYTENNYHDAAKIFHKMLTNGYQDRTIYKMTGVAYIQAKNYEAARSIYSECEEKYTLDADDYCNWALLSSHMKRNRERDECYKKVLELNPNHAYALNNIGYGLITEKRFNEAIPYLNKAIKHMPTMAYAYNNRGHAMLETGKLEQGLADIHHSLKLDNTNAYAYRNLGIYHLKLKQYEEAYNLFLKAREITPETDLVDELLQQTAEHITPRTPN